MAFTKQERLDKLVRILQDSQSWVSAPALARLVGVSDRSIRSYIGELNASKRLRIASSQKGYRLACTATSDGAAAPISAGGTSKDDSPNARRNRVCVRLINTTEPVPVFDLANELYVSESTVMNSILPHVRTLYARFNVKLVGHGFRFSAEGSEQAKRRVLGYLATHDTHSYFTSAETLGQLFPHLDVKDIMGRAVSLAQGSELIINNYALNNLLVHLLIIIARLRDGNELAARGELPVDVEQLIEKTGQEREVRRLASAFTKLADEEAGCSIPSDDQYQIELLVAMSVERYDAAELDYEKLVQLVDQELLERVRSLITKTAKRYGIEPFDDEFLLQLALHMYNVYQRSVFKVRCPNPLAALIKRDYAPVYDMAVYFCLQFARESKISINEDEIAFVAFHIGAYLERTEGSAGAMSCVIVLEDYHAFSRDIVHGLEESFSGELVVADVMSASHYLEAPSVCDILVCTLDIPSAHPHKVLVGPIITRRGIHRVRCEMDAIEEERCTKRARAFLRSVLSPELYLYDERFDSAEACIRALAQRCVEVGVARKGLAEDVLAREATSSTAFTDDLAIPHPITSHAKSSFICVLHTTRAISWDCTHQVRFVLLIDIIETDMRLFRSIFELIVERFRSVEDVMALTATESYEEFSDALVG